MKSVAVRRQREAKERKRAHQGAAYNGASSSSVGNIRSRGSATTNAVDREVAAQLSREAADENMQTDGHAISARDLMDDDGPPVPSAPVSLRATTPLAAEAVRGPCCFVRSLRGRL